MSGVKTVELRVRGLYRELEEAVHTFEVKRILAEDPNKESVLDLAGWVVSTIDSLPEWLQRRMWGKREYASAVIYAYGPDTNSFEQRRSRRYRQVQ